MRSNRHRPRKQPKLSRPIPVYGDPDRGGGLDSGVWYRCWYCKQLNSTNKSSLGGSESSDGVVYVDYADNPDYGETFGIAVLGGISNTFTAQRNASDGNPAKVKNSIMVSSGNGKSFGVAVMGSTENSDGGSGCSLCGSRNWRGDH